MRINDELINRLSELSMIEIREDEKEYIAEELEELIEKLQVVSKVKLEECEVIENISQENGDKNRKKSNITISSINDYVIDNYVVIERTVGEE